MNYEQEILNQTLDANEAIARKLAVSKAKDYKAAIEHDFNAKCEEFYKSALDAVTASHMDAIKAFAKSDFKANRDRLMARMESTELELGVHQMPEIDSELDLGDDEDIMTAFTSKARFVSESVNTSDGVGIGF